MFKKLFGDENGKTNFKLLGAVLTDMSANEFEGISFKKTILPSDEKEGGKICVLDLLVSTMQVTVFSEQFYFVRHGETEFNSRGIVSGDHDVPLSPAGIAQSLAAAEIVADLNISSAFCSPLTRAHDTALNILSKTNLSPIVIKGLKERHWGRLQGISKKDLDKFDFAENGVEDWDIFSRRTIEALRAIKAIPPVLIVAHSGTFRVLLNHLKIDLEKKQVRNSHPYRFFQNGSEWKVEECQAI
jgi:probable phosphoglycerate mutase